MTIETLVRDDTGPNPDVAKRLAQELVVRDKVDFLAGVIVTPNALAIAPLTAEAKVPFVIMNAGIRSSPPVRPICCGCRSRFGNRATRWANEPRRSFKTAYTLVSDFGPGHDTEEAFAKGFKEGGGTIVRATLPITARTTPG